LRAVATASTVGNMGFNYNEYFDRQPDVCGGALVVKGTRVPVRTVLASFAEGSTTEEVLADFPTLTKDSLRAVVAFAAAAAGDDLPVGPSPTAAPAAAA